MFEVPGGPSKAYKDQDAQFFRSGCNRGSTDYPETYLCIGMIPADSYNFLPRRLLSVRLFIVPRECVLARLRAVPYAHHLQDGNPSFDDGRSVRTCPHPSARKLAGMEPRQILLHDPMRISINLAYARILSLDGP
jgi:hypothetical protein